MDGRTTTVTMSNNEDPTEPRVNGNGVSVNGSGGVKKREDEDGNSCDASNDDNDDDDDDESGRRFCRKNFARYGNKPRWR
jgi:hypothetical protein